MKKNLGSAKFSFAFIYNNETFGVWYDYNHGKIYVSNDYINSPLTFACTLKEHTPNTLLLKTAKKYSFWKSFIENYGMGNVRFENMKIKLICQELIKMIITK